MQKTLAQKYPILGSSQDSEKISLTISSLAVLVVSVAGLLGFDFEPGDVTLVITNIVSIISMGGVIWGVIRKYKK